MSRRSSRGDDYAPAMFPFLAVLLCTIGALVLILVISVVHSHASAKRDMDDEWNDRVERAQEQSDYLATVSQELAARREKIKKEIDRRRKELANVEEHIQRLQTQLDRLRSQVESIVSVDDQAQPTRMEQEKKIEGLRAEIEAKKREIASEVENAKNKKLAFSIIPYDGPNGTSRRPVYLECRADGVVIQPEGILISVRELRPPYGPGNPIDAALRILRTAYQKRDTTFGLTIPPYPLLIVRPDGIHSYAMARAAMSSWDDQFGYELVEADLDLVFPPGVPSLKEELISVIDTARRRQEALASSLPRQYTQSSDFDEIDIESLSPDHFRQQNDMSEPWSSRSRDRKDWTMIDEMPGVRIVETDAGGTAGETTLPPHGSPLSSPPQQTAQPDSRFHGGMLNAARAQNVPQGSTSLSQSSSPSSSQEDSSGNTSASPPGTVSPPSRANAFSSGNSSGSPLPSSRSPDSPSTPESEAIEKATREHQEKQDALRKPSTKRPTKFTKAEDESSGSIASNRGAGWAIPDKDPKASPVTRPIRIVVLEDRWLIRKEGSETEFDTEIDLDQGPQHASSKLEKAIRNRVDSWGLSLPGGYWCPSITMESASDSQKSTQRLRKLLDGSGVEIRVLPLQAPPLQTIRPEPNSSRR